MLRELKGESLLFPLTALDGLQEVAQQRPDPHGLLWVGRSVDGQHGEVKLAQPRGAPRSPRKEELSDLLLEVFR